MAAEPPWCRRSSMAFTASHGGLAPSTLSLLSYDALSSKADLPTATNCAASKINGSASRLLEHRPESIKAAKQKTRVVTEVRHDKALVHHLRSPADHGIGNPKDAKRVWYYPCCTCASATGRGCTGAPTHSPPAAMQHHGEGVSPASASMMTAWPTTLMPVRFVPGGQGHAVYPPQVEAAQPASYVYYALPQASMGSHPPSSGEDYRSTAGQRHEPSSHSTANEDSPFNVFFHVAERSPSWQGRFGGPFRQVQPSNLAHQQHLTRASPIL